MAGANIRLDLKTLAVRQRLQGGIDGLANPKPMLAEIREYLIRAHRQRFRDQTAPDGTPWAALSPRYKKRKHRNRNRILTLRRHLQGQLVGQFDTSGLLFGTNRKYGAAHQFGRDEIGLPARPWLGTSEKDDQHIADIALRHLEKATSR